MGSVLKENKKLMIALAVLIFIIIGLIVGVIVIHMNNKESGCLAKSDDDEIIQCLGSLHANGDESIDESYIAVMNKALDDGNYDLFENAMFDRTVDLALERECDKAYEFIDDEQWLSRLPDDVKTTYYERAQDVAVECGDEDKFDYYGEKWDEIYWTTVYDNEEFYDEQTEEDLEEIEEEEEEYEE